MRAVTNRTPAEYNQWNKGLITEASPLTFPEGASLEEENFVLDIDGSRARRLGLDFESGNASTDLSVSATMSGLGLSSFIWTNVAEDPALDWAVQQVGSRLYFFDANTTAVSSNSAFANFLSLTASTGVRYQFASIQGFLVAATGDQEVKVIQASFNTSGTSSLAVTDVRLEIRDFYGVDDGLAVNERTTSLSPAHAYNLYNQGWQKNAKRMPGNSAAARDIVEGTFQGNQSIGGYPSNSDVWFSARRVNNEGEIVYVPSDLADHNTPAAKGHFIIDLFTRGTSREATYQGDIDAGLTARVDYSAALGDDSAQGGVAVVASFAGRVFYAVKATGISGSDERSPKIGTFVLFTQLVDGISDLSKCYQDADPTAEDVSDVIATDGGYVQIPDAVLIRSLVVLQQSLLVFASNGVWEITGGETGFSATEYQVRFLSNNGAINPQSIVQAASAVMYWSRNGVYVIARDEVGNLQAQSLTEVSIQTLYDDIPYPSKAESVGVYDDDEYRVRWLYNSTSATANNRFDRELILDLRINAWSQFTIKTLTSLSPYAIGYLPVPVQSRDKTGVSLKYATMHPAASGKWSFTASYYNETKFRDWYTKDSTGRDAEAFLVTGYLTGGDSARNKVIPWMTIHMKKTESGWVQNDDCELELDDPSCLLVQAQWEWHKTTTGGRWGTEFQAYRPRQLYLPSGLANDIIDTGASVVTTRNKIRGRGRAISFKMRTEAECNAIIYGWNLEVGANEEP